MPDLKDRRRAVLSLNEPFEIVDQSELNHLLGRPTGDKDAVGEIPE
jgi:hypothetical protein